MSLSKTIYVSKTFHETLKMRDYYQSIIQFIRVKPLAISEFDIKPTELGAIQSAADKLPSLTVEL